MNLIIIGNSDSLLRVASRNVLEDAGYQLEKREAQEQTHRTPDRGHDGVEVEQAILFLNLDICR